MSTMAIGGYNTSCAGSRRICARSCANNPAKRCMGNEAGRERRSSLRYVSVHDQLATGRKLRILSVVDTYSRLSPVVEPRFSYRGEDVVATLDRACRKIGYPKMMRVENGREFISRDMDLLAYQRGVILELASTCLGSPALVSQQTMRLSKHSTASCAASA